MALRIFGVAPTLGEKDVALKVGETAASHRTPLHTPLCVIVSFAIDPLARLQRVVS